MVDQNSTHANSQKYQRHPKYYLEDGSLLILCGTTLYRVHKTLLLRHSGTLKSLIDQNPIHISASEAVMHSMEHGSQSSCSMPASIALRNDDLEALLEHVYHDIPLNSDTGFARVASVLRASSPKQLDFEAIHELSRKYVEAMFPSGPEPFIHPNCLEEALVLSTEYDIPIRKCVLYSLVTSSDFDTGGDDKQPKSSGGLISAATPSSLPASRALSLSPADAQSCRHLMNKIIDHFTPILFTPAATRHMACTDVFADTWMTLVIQPALENDGVYKPLESLKRIIDIDWESEGLCPSCVLDKRGEWKEEQEDVWRRMDGWIG